MHLQKTILIAICVSLVCLAHSVTAMNNPEYQEGVRKRANDQPSTSQFDEASLTKHSMSTKEIEDIIIAEEGKRERKIEEIEIQEEEEEDNKTVLNRGLKWATKNQDSIFKTILFVILLVVTIWVLSQLFIFPSTNAASIARNILRPERWDMQGYYYNDSTYNSSNVIIEKVTEAEESSRNMDMVLETIQTEIETTTTWIPHNKTDALSRSNKVEGYFIW
ncbi:hypothetical protein NECID01_1823 [Nematocida sp. AWRm77]|nr:hypothetical protein NECID01_1823 [Nematocida sp. AWRm77]